MKISIYQRIMLTLVGCTLAAVLLSGFFAVQGMRAVLETVELTESGVSTVRMYIGALIVSLAMLAVVMVALGHRLSKHLTMPIRQVSDGVKELAAGHLDTKLDIHTEDEIETLADTFNEMTDDLKHYVEHVEQEAAEKERVATEMDVAGSIQKNLLPSVFPPYPEHQEFDIYATMKPAKKIGGDFYDFFLVDENHLIVTVADVSGKGVPAALFMVISKTILKNDALMMRTADELSSVLSCANRQLAENNRDLMFVTVFLGMLELTTGRFSYVSAGHTLPLIHRQGSREFEFLHPKKNGMVGVVADMNFEQDEMMLAAGDEVFLYTDGVTEAANREMELFGERRLQEALNETLDGRGCREMLDHVKVCIDAFVQEAPQTDDLTMLGLRYRGRKILQE